MIKNKAYSRVIERRNKELFFDSIYVREEYRRQGIATKLLDFSIAFFGKYPELDIRAQSKVAQRIAAKAGYKMQKESDRYNYCHLWKNARSANNDKCPSLSLTSTTIHKNKIRETHVHYLRA